MLAFARDVTVPPALAGGRLPRAPRSRLRRRAGVVGPRLRLAGLLNGLSAGEALPFADGAYDAVVSQFGHMFCPAGAVREMLRVFRPGLVLDGVCTRPGTQGCSSIPCRRQLTRRWSGW